MLVLVVVMVMMGLSLLFKCEDDLRKNSLTYLSYPSPFILTSSLSRSLSLFISLCRSLSFYFSLSLSLSLPFSFFLCLSHPLPLRLSRSFLSLARSLTPSLFITKQETCPTQSRDQRDQSPEATGQLVDNCWTRRGRHRDRSLCGDLPLIYNSLGDFPC